MARRRLPVRPMMLSIACRDLDDPRLSAVTSSNIFVPDQIPHHLCASVDGSGPDLDKAEGGMKAAFWHVYQGVDASLKTPHRAGSDPYRNERIRKEPEVSEEPVPEPAK